MSPRRSRRRPSKEIEVEDTTKMWAHISDEDLIIRIKLSRDQLEEARLFQERLDIPFIRANTVYDKNDLSFRLKRTCIFYVASFVIEKAFNKFSNGYDWEMNDTACAEYPDPFESEESLIHSWQELMEVDPPNGKPWPKEKFPAIIRAALREDDVEVEKKVKQICEDLGYDRPPEFYNQ